MFVCVIWVQWHCDTYKRSYSASAGVCKCMRVCVGELGGALPPSTPGQWVNSYPPWVRGRTESHQWVYSVLPQLPGGQEISTTVTKLLK